MEPSLFCPCGENSCDIPLEYTSKPDGETAFPFDGEYWRQYKRCLLCGHFFSSHSICLDNLYDGMYSDATYGADRESVFQRIMNLPANQSDNAERCRRINSFFKSYRKVIDHRKTTLLDIGSGLGVFPARMHMNGWEVTALDPDAKAIDHIKKRVGCECIHGDFMDQTITQIGKYDLITFNKVLEHVERPTEMLKRGKELLNEKGVVYIEVPDGENAIIESKNREEFYIEHHHFCWYSQK